MRHTAVIYTALAVLATAVSQPVGQGMAIQITKRFSLLNTDKSVDVDALKSHVALVKAKIRRGLDNHMKNTGTPHPSAVEEEGVAKRGAGEALTNFNKGQVWFGTVWVGTPDRDTGDQTFVVEFDTGSGDFFIPHVDCADPICVDHPRWDPRSSLTSNDLGQEFTIQYGGAPYSGELYTDDVTVAGFTATNQTIGAALSFANSAASPTFITDGVMGMGLNPLSNFNSSPFFDTLIHDGQLSDEAFSFKLTESGSELYIGGSNGALYTGAFTYVQVTTPSFWQIPMDNLLVNGRVLMAGIDSVIDTGSDLIMGPPNKVSALYAAIGGTASPGSGEGIYTLPCNNFPAFGLTYGGRSFDMDLNLGPLGSNPSECISGILGGDTGATFWTVGTIFLQNVYTRFDVGRGGVGFASLA